MIRIRFPRIEFDHILNKSGFDQVVFNTENYLAVNFVLLVQRFFEMLQQDRQYLVEISLKFNNGSYKTVAKGKIVSTWKEEVYNLTSYRTRTHIKLCRKQPLCQLS